VRDGLHHVRQVSENYDAARRGDYGAIGAKF